MEYRKILVTGGNGFLGKHVFNELKLSYPSSEIITFSTNELDLRERDATIDYINDIQPDAIISVAARLGGIGDNQRFPASYFYDNMSIGINTIDAARLSNCKKLVLIGTVCSYPKITPAPFKEEDLWNGYPEPTNGAYGIAKKAVAEYAIAVKKQYGLSVVNLLLTNLYGPGDDFRNETSHVIPAIIKKIIAAKEQNIGSIEAWGDGSPTRDFLFVKDAAKAIVTALNYENEMPVNIGAGKEISIKELLYLLSDLLNYDGDVKWLTDKPNGQPRRLLDVSKARDEMGFQSSHSFKEGLKQTVEWYIENKEYLDRLPKKFKE